MIMPPAPVLEINVLFSPKVLPLIFIPSLPVFKILILCSLLSEVPPWVTRPLTVIPFSPALSNVTEPFVTL